MSHPSVPNCRIIIQTVIGGLTQYLTTVQGMPKHIEDLLEKRERKFIWESQTKNLVSLETLKSPRNQGGLDILDIRLRNKVIEVMWIKELLSEEKPTWTYFAHDMIAHQGTKAEINIPKEVKSNIFLQSFNTKKSMLPLDLQRIVRPGLHMTSDRPRLQLSRIQTITGRMAGGLIAQRRRTNVLVEFCSESEAWYR
ncbi:hypothetical protein F5146DRAFT_938456 [Armillaria mellea]|nr:hypothetical protein F5146DRAFT_938456 [Armillaria mellea]